MDLHVPPDHIIYRKSVLHQRMVHYHICIGHLSFKSIHCFSLTQNWSSNVRLWSWRWSRITNASEWRVPPFHPPFAWIQILVLGDQVNCHCLCMHFLWILQCPRFLAYTRDVLHHTLLPHHETTDQAYDQVPIHTFHPRQTKVSGGPFKKYSRSHPKEMKRWCLVLWIETESCHTHRNFFIVPHSLWIHLIAFFFPQQKKKMS